MSTTTLVQNISSHGLETYEGSYFDIFAHLDYKFLPFQEEEPTKRPGRPDLPKNALFKACLLRFLLPEGSFRMTDAHLKKDLELAGLLGFHPEELPSDSTLKTFFQNLSASRLHRFQEQLIRELLARGVLDPATVALDSSPLEVRSKPPTKRHPTPVDPDARWGYAKSKGGWYYGYKAHLLVDVHSGLPLAGTITAANVSDQKIPGSFIGFLKNMGVHPEIWLEDKGYDSGANHLRPREELGTLPLIALNPRRQKKRPRQKAMKKHWDGKVQLTLDRFIPKKTRMRKYRQQCAEILETREGKQLFQLRSAIERTLAWLKENLKLERIEFRGFKQVLKHFLMKCIALLLIALAAVRSGVPEAIRSIRYFQR